MARCCHKLFIGPMKWTFSSYIFCQGHVHSIPFLQDSNLCLPFHSII